MKRIFLPLAAISLCSAAASGFQHPLKPNPNNAQQESTKLYIIRVIDAASKRPVVKAKIAVELENLAKSKWSGLTDPNGFFQFKSELMRPNVKARISIEARGYASLEDYGLLIEDRLIELHRTQ
ncbi:MAG TPA: hypothetical protein VI636_14145 [Candidatus Angelobacter sp.]